jgi:hypothetical protein
VQILLTGAILAPSKRTVTAALRVMGLSDDRHFQIYHRVLNRAVWSSLAMGRILLGMLVQTFVPTGTIVLGIDETIERRRGGKIKAKGIYRDPVRSSRSHFVKASGLHWLSVMLLAPIPWAQKVWALPFLTILAPSECFYQERPRGHKKVTDWARQALLQVRRWLPGRKLVAVADNTYAAIDLWARLTQLPDPIYMVARLRLVTLLAHQLASRGQLPVHKAAWHVKQWPTFSDALAAVCYQLWHRRGFHLSLPEADVVEISRSLLSIFIDTLCYAA